MSEEAPVTDELLAGLEGRPHGGRSAGDGRAPERRTGRRAAGGVRGPRGARRGLRRGAGERARAGSDSPGPRAGGGSIRDRSTTTCVAAFLTAGHSSRLSQAALETLAVVAYRQPVTRARISAIRGVNVDGVVRTLLLRGLLVESGTDPTTGAVRFVTTPAFLEAAGLERIEDLPDIAPFLPEGDEANRTGEAGAADVAEFGIMGE